MFCCYLCLKTTLLNFVRNPNLFVCNFCNFYSVGACRDLSHSRVPAKRTLPKVGASLFCLLLILPNRTVKKSLVHHPIKYFMRIPIFEITATSAWTGRPGLGIDVTCPLRCVKWTSSKQFVMLKYCEHLKFKVVEPAWLWDENHSWFIELEKRLRSVNFKDIPDMFLSLINSIQEHNVPILCLYPTVEGYV